MGKLKYRQAILLGLWLLGSYLFFRIFEFIMETPELDLWALMALGLALYLFVHHPLRDLQFPQALEVGVAVVLAGLFVIHFGLVVVAPRLDADANDNEPCGVKTKESQCYNLSHESCISVWENYKKECMAEIQNLAKRPTQLIGSGVKKCVQRKMNKHVSYNQKRDNAGDCKSYFDDLKD